MKKIVGLTEDEIWVEVVFKDNPKLTLEFYVDYETNKVYQMESCIYDENDVCIENTRPKQYAPTQ
ncbi:hypothetical protein OKW22_000605 [Bacilli bacterium PM5-3]|nr:hypothetical protein [Bacilli bacterium PM5-3]MDH6603865.1 hypothetical protein [Bacilli bacterium PM5-9]